jgi:hypothetical protein
VKQHFVVLGSLIPEESVKWAWYCLAPIFPLFQLTDEGITRALDHRGLWWWRGLSRRRRERSEVLRDTLASKAALPEHTALSRTVRLPSDNVSCATRCAGWAFSSSPRGKTSAARSRPHSRSRARGIKKIQILHRAFLVADHKIATWVLRAAVRQSFFFLKMKKWLLSGSHVKANMMTCTNLTK